MSRFSRKKVWAFVKPWLPVALVLIAVIASTFGFVWCATFFGDTILPMVPVLTLMGSMAGLFFLSMTAVKETVVTRMFYPSSKSTYRKELKALKKERARYVGYAFGDRGDAPSSYLRNIQNIDIKIGELTGKGYDAPDYNPSSR